MCQMILSYTKWTFLICLISMSNGLLNLTRDCNCKGLHPLTRISNGSKVDDRDLQYSGTIYLERDIGNGAKQRRVNLCGAVLLNSKWAITTAACSFDIREVNETFTAYLSIGKHFEHSVHNRTYSKVIKRVHTHPSYEENFKIVPVHYNVLTTVYDVAMIEIFGHFELGSKYNIYPVCLNPIEGTKLNKADFIISGFNLMDKTPKHELLALRVKQTDELCDTIKPFEAKKNTLCLDVEKGNVCRGDFGGPVLHTFDDGHSIGGLGLIGIIRSSSYVFGETVDVNKCKGKLILTELIYHHFTWIRSFLNEEMCLVVRESEEHLPWNYILWTILLLCFVAVVTLYKLILRPTKIPPQDSKKLSHKFANKQSSNVDKTSFQKVNVPDRV